MESLQESVNKLRESLKVVQDNLYFPLENDKKTAIADKETLPLCQVTRIYRLETIVNIFSTTIDATQLFIDDEEVEQKAPKEIIITMAQALEKETNHMVGYCSSEMTPLFLSTLPGNRGPEIERRITALHGLIEQVLGTLKKSALELKIAGVKPACDFKHDEPDGVQPNGNRKNSYMMERQRSMDKMRPLPRRQISFMGHDVVKTLDDNGQLNINNTVYADSLLKQLPIKYDSAN